MAKFLDTLETPPYARMKVLGCGPYSVVDEVRNLATGAVFARKTITFPKSREPSLFMTEVKIMKKLDHPHIVRFVDTYTLDKSVSILMSPVADFDLGDLMNKYPTAELIPVDTIIQWFGCLVSSVKYLHGKSIKHQDIKPSNILIKGQMIFLADFGIAKIFMDSDSTTSTSGDMTMKYCSPETALRGLRGRKADVFSLGCVFLEMFNLLIPQGRAKFEHFQERHSIGGGTYHENLRMVELWIGVLRQEPAFEGDSILWQLLDTCQAMLGESREDRPSAADLYATLPAGKCCLLAEKEFDSKSALEEKQSASSNTPLAPFHSSPQPAHLADQMPTTNEQSSQQMQVSGHGRELLPSQMPHNSMRSESLCSECNNCGPSWGLILGKTAGSYVPRVWIILTLIGCLLLVLVNSHFPLRETGSYGSQVHILTKVVVISRVNPESSPRELSVVDAIPTALLEPRTPIKRLSEAPAFGRDILPRSPPSVDPSFEIILSGPTFQYLRELRKLWGETDMVRQICRDHKASQMEVRLRKQVLITRFSASTKLMQIQFCHGAQARITGPQAILPSRESSCTLNLYKNLILVSNNMAVLEAETLGVDDDHLDIFSTHCVSTIVDLLDEKGFSWREYQEDMPYACPSGFKFSNKPQDSPLLINRAIGSGPNSTLLALTNNFTSNPNFAAETVPQSSPRTLNMTNDGHYTAFSRGVAPGKVNVVV
jgi:serine/threonine protein kinase